MTAQSIVFPHGLISPQGNLYVLAHCYEKECASDSIDHVMRRLERWCSPESSWDHLFKDLQVALFIPHMNYLTYMCPSHNKDLNGYAEWCFTEREYHGAAVYELIL